MKLRLQSSKRLFTYSIVVAGIAVLVGASIVIPKITTQALSASDFVAGRIIDDSVFYNKDAMNASQIQDFLNKLIPNCDTWGTAKSEYGGGTRAQYAASVGWPSPPYVCLNNYYENTTTGETSFEKGGGAFDSGTSAAQIIYNAAQQYGINPQVLLVMLRKESSGPLTTDSWPLKSQYKYAMGYACPDSGANNSANCNTSQAGFYNQVTKAAWQLKYYKDHQNDYRYKLGANQIQYSPDVTCGTKMVNIENIATLSLYIYTPYTPNDTALANYPGTAPCGAYGNRNFFMYFKEWFGSPNYRPPTCDAKVANTTCVWLLFDPTERYEFLTTDNTERDAAVLSSKYSYDSIAFYAFTSQQPGTIPVYRIKLSDRHFYTTSSTEMQTLTQDSQNTYEGVAFYVYPASADTNASYPIHRLYGDRGQVLTSNSSDKDTLMSTGYSYEGLAFNTPSGLTSAPDPTPSRSNIYRLTNSKDHLYTQSLSERDSLIKGGWAYEGILQDAPSVSTSSPVYRLFNGTHIFTTSDKERGELMQKGWKYEGIAWYTDSKTTPVYRFYVNGHHFFTTSFDEAASITNKGASFEGIVFGSPQGTDIPVYRLFNGSQHFFTADSNEALSIINTSWRYEGVGWLASTQGTPVYRLNGPYHFYTTNTAERDLLLQNNWKSEGIGWLAPKGSPVVYRLKGPYYFYTASADERDSLVKVGWKYEGIAW